MPRIAGVDIPENRKVDIALTYIYGIGRNNVLDILSQAKVDASKRAKDLSNDELSKLARIIDKINVEGNLRKQVRENIQRLKHINTYRGSRHAKNLPVKGQRTKTNSRTKRGKRMTIGAVSKDQKK